MTKGTPTLLLVHGSWHGPWCWEKLTPKLEALGLPWATVALPSVGDAGAALGSIFDDAAAIEAAVAGIAGDVVVVAHSYGGVPATQATYSDKVRHIVYLGAFMPDLGQGLVNLLPPGPLPPFVHDNGDGTTSIEPGHAVPSFYADCTPEDAAWAVARLRRHNGINNVTPVTHCAWRETGSSYILLTEDFACPTWTQRQTAHQAADVHEMTGCHSPFLSKPAELADLLSTIVARHAGNGLRKTG
jgi:pimeloyl-ACP methyl ester carboxylesterase